MTAKRSILDESARQSMCMYDLPYTNLPLQMLYLSLSHEWCMKE